MTEMTMALRPGKSASPAHKPTILVVEDEPFARMYAAQLFEDQGFAVIETESAEEAIQALREHPEVALLFADIRLAGEVSGLALAGLARSMRPQLAILLTSGYAQPPDLDIPRSGKFLAKPYTAQMLLETARELVGAG
jgi:CheY-like chemotaxis protein